MSAQPFENVPEATPPAPTPEAYAPQAQAAVDILPVAGGRKSRQPEPAPTAPQHPADQAVDPTWGAPAPVDPAWGAAVAAQSPAQPDVPAEPSAAPPAPLVYTGSIPPTVAVPVFPGGGLPAAEPVEAVQVIASVASPAVETSPSVETSVASQSLDTETTGDAATPSAKRFLGMQLRRQRRGEPASDGSDVEPGPEAPLAAWPTDVGLPVVATAEPATPAPWGPPVERVAGQLPGAEDEPAAADVPPVEPPPVDVAPTPPMTPVPVPADDDEIRSLRTLLEASDARRSAAEQRADSAVAYAQQLQTQLTEVTSDLEGRLQAAETRTRTAANEAQDWQIRHREAQAQIAELAASLGGAEQRLADVRAERDELMGQLEQVTGPVHEDAVAELDA